MKTKSTHRHLHPVHWHGSMLLAIAAILVTATKTSGELMRSLHGAAPVQNAIISSLTLRDAREAETAHQEIILGGLARFAHISGV